MSGSSVPTPPSSWRSANGLGSNLGHGFGEPSKPDNSLRMVGQRPADGPSEGCGWSGRDLRMVRQQPEDGRTETCGWSEFFDGGVAEEEAFDAAGAEVDAGHGLVGLA